MWTMLLKFKDEALEALKNVKNKAEMETRLKMEALRIDQGGEFNSKDFNIFC